MAATFCDRLKLIRIRLLQGCQDGRERAVNLARFTGRPESDFLLPVSLA